MTVDPKLTDERIQHILNNTDWSAYERAVYEASQEEIEQYRTARYESYKLCLLKN